MRSLLCKIFRFILNVFEQVVNVVASAIGTVGNAVVDVLTDIWDGTVGSGGVGGLLALGAIGLFAYFLITSGDDDDKVNVRTDGLVSRDGVRSSYSKDVSYV